MEPSHPLPHPPTPNHTHTHARYIRPAPSRLGIGSTPFRDATLVLLHSKLSPSVLRYRCSLYVALEDVKAITYGAVCPVQFSYHVDLSILDWRLNFMECILFSTEHFTILFPISCKQEFDKQRVQSRQKYFDKIKIEAKITKNGYSDVCVH